MDTTSATRSSFSLREPIAVLFKRRKQLWGVFAATVVLTALGAYLGPREYLAYSTVYVERHIPPIADSGPRSSFMALDRKEVLSSEVDFIKSRAVAERVADEMLAAQGAEGERKRPLVGRMARALRGAIRETMVATGLVDPVDEREAMIAFVRNQVEAEPALQSNLITISMKATNRHQAASVVNAVTRTYLEQRLALMKRPGLDQFYEQHIARTRSALQDIEDQTKQLKESAGIVAVDEEVRLKLQELSEAETELTRVRSEVRELRERIASLREQLGGLQENVTVSRLVSRNPTIVELERRRLELEAQKAAELNRFTPESQPIRDLEKSIERINDAIEAEQPTVLDSESIASNSVYTGLLGDTYRAESDLSAKLAREAAIALRVDTLTQELQKLNERADEFHRLSTSLASAERIYYGYLERREEVAVEERTDPSSTNVRVVHEAAVPQRPMYSRLAAISIGAGVGLFLALGLVFASEFFDHSLCTREDIERHLELPLLASLPESESIRRPL